MYFILLDYGRKDTQPENYCMIVAAHMTRTTAEEAMAKYCQHFSLLSFLILRELIPQTGYDNVYEQDNDIIDQFYYKFHIQYYGGPMPFKCDLPPMDDESPTPSIESIDVATL
jgi:hypothetical protein